MKKNKMYKLLAIFLLSGVITTSAQDGHMSINMGASMPLGDFASSGSFLENGYAKTGFNLNLDGVYIPTWYFGIGANVSFSTYGLDNDLVEKDLIDLIENTPNLPELPENSSVTFTVGSWSYANIMVGPVFALPVSKFQFNAKALFGLCILMPPGNNLSVINIDNGEEFQSYSEPQNARFGYLFGADIIYKLSDTYSLKLGGDYLHSKTNYEVNFTQINDVAETELPSLQSNISVDAMSVTLGIAYLF